MSDFEAWFLEVIGIADEKMSIQLGVCDMDKFSWSFNEGLSPMAAVKKHYGLNT